MTRPSLKQARRSYAEELRATWAVRDARVVRAFAAVPREDFFPPGPWHTLASWTLHASRTPDADPRRLYHDILVAIDRKRGLNNGQPGFWAFLFGHLAIRRGERVLQVGTGTGYYTAILAALVGRRGHVAAVEYDRGLARRTRANLAPWTQVEVAHGDGTSFDAGPVDLVIAFCGATHPAPLWLDRLKPGGRLLMPLTGPNGLGFMLLAERRKAGFTARAVSRVGIFPCVGGRSKAAAERLARALRRLRGGKVPVTALHRGAPPASARRKVWYAGPGFWLEAPPARRRRRPAPAKSRRQRPTK